MEGIDIQEIVRQEIRAYAEGHDLRPRQSCGKEVQAAEVVAFLGEVMEAGSQALVTLLEGPERPKQATCADVGAATSLLREAAKALARIGGR